MKKVVDKIIAILLVIVVLLSFSACEKGYHSEFVRTDQIASKGWVETSNLFKSFSQLEEFLQQIKNDNEDYVLQLFAKFDEEFFESNNLALIGIIETSGSNRHKIKSLEIFADTIMINISRHVQQIGTCDMAYWHLFLSISKTFFNGNNLLVTII